MKIVAMENLSFDSPEKGTTHINCGQTADVPDKLGATWIREGVAAVPLVPRPDRRIRAMEDLRFDHAARGPVAVACGEAALVPAEVAEKWVGDGVAEFVPPEKG